MFPGVWMVWKQVLSWRWQLNPVMSHVFTHVLELHMLHLQGTRLLDTVFSTSHPHWDCSSLEIKKLAKPMRWRMEIASWQLSCKMCFAALEIKQRTKHSASSAQQCTIYHTPIHTNQKHNTHHLAWHNPNRSYTAPLRHCATLNGLCQTLSNREPRNWSRSPWIHVLTWRSNSQGITFCRDGTHLVMFKFNRDAVMF